MSGCWPCASRLRSIGWRSWLAAAAALADVVSVRAGGDGLHVRRTPVMADRLTADPDRTRPRIIGPDVAGDGRHWRHVAAPDGSQGYVPAELVDAEP